MKWLYKHRILHLLIVFLLVNFTKAHADSEIEIIDVITTQETCHLGNGTITIIIDDPNPSTLYSIDNGVNFQTSNYFSNLESGDYLLIVINDSGCSATMTVQLVDAPEPQVGLNINCLPGQNQVNIDMTPFAFGIFPFRYQWMTPDTMLTTEDVANGPPGEYTLFVTDRLGCMTDTTFVVEPCCQLKMTCPSDTSYLNCLSELNDIPAEFLDNSTNGNQDSIILANMGIMIDSMCNHVVVTMQETILSEGICGIEDRHLMRSLLVDDGVTSLSCEFHYYITNFEELTSNQVPENLELDCAEDIDLLISEWITNQGGQLVTGCEEPFNHSYSPDPIAIDYSCIGTGELAVTFITTDACGSQIENTAFITVTDNTAPDITCPADLTIDSRDIMMESLIIDWLDTATGTDNCSYADINHDFEVFDYSMVCTDSLITVSFEAIDDCQNTNTCQASISLINTFNPQLNCPDNLEINCSNTDNSQLIQDWLDQFSASSGNEMLPLDIITTISPDMALSCSQMEMIQVLLIDNCVQNINCERSLIVMDDNAPEIICPPGITVDSRQSDIENVIALWLEDVQTTDDCSLVSPSHNYITQNWEELCFSTEIEVVFSVVDNCNNANSCISQLNVLASEDIEFNCPDDLILQCKNLDHSVEIDNWISEFTAEISGMNIPINIESQYTSDYAFSCNESLPFTITIDDVCAQDFECVRYINIDDSSIPVITCPNDITIDNRNPNIEQEINLWLMEVRSTDNCSAVNLSNDYQSQDWSQLCSAVLLDINFIAEDDCNNTSNCTAQINITTDSDYLLECPDNLVINCSHIDNSIAIDAWMDEFNASLSGNPLNISFSTNYNNGYNFLCVEEVSVIASVNDACATGLECERFIIVDDSISPIINCPDDITIDNRNPDIDNLIDDWINQTTAQDLCDNANIDNDFQSENWQSLCTDQILSVSFIAIDDCNNSSSCEALLTIQTDSNFEFNCPEDLIIECSQHDQNQRIQDWLEEFNANLSGSELTVDFQTDYIENYSFTCSEQLPVLATVDDQCANGLECERYIIIDDNTAPNIQCPQDLTVDNRDPDINTEISDWLNLASAQDACDPVAIINDYQAMDWLQLCSDETLIVQFSTMDNCNNSNKCTAQIEILTDSNFEFNCPDNLIIECSQHDQNQNVQDWLNEFNANLSGTSLVVDIQTNYVQGYNFACAEQIPVLATVNDQCAAGIECERFIIIDDTEGPELNCPQDISVNTRDNNKEDLIASWLTQISAIDNCDQIQVDNNYVSPDWLQICNNYDLSIAFTAEDACQNVSTCNSIISIIAENQITFDCPDDYLISCSMEDHVDPIQLWLDSFYGETAGVSIPVIINTTYNSSHVFLCSENIPVIVTLDDACASDLECIRHIIVNDDKAPDIFCPEDITVDSRLETIEDEINSWLETAQSGDDCNTPLVTNDFEPIDYSALCETIDIDVSFVASDNCNNISNCQSTLSLVPIFNPVINCPENLEISCIDDQTHDEIQNWISEFSAASFNTGLEVLIDTDYSSDLTLGCNDIFEFNCSINDPCATDIKCHRRIRLLDETAPDLECPEVLVLNILDENPENLAADWINSLYMSDNCTIVDYGSSYDPAMLADLCESDQEIEIVFYAVDDCQNRSECQSSIQVEYVPITLSCPQNITIECNEAELESEIYSWMESALSSDTYDNSYIVENDFDNILLNQFCDNSYLITFRSSDACELEYSCSSTVQIIDTKAPEIICPEESYINIDDLDADQQLDGWLNSVQATDDCHAVEITHAFTIDLAEIICEEVFMVEFEAEDECGNTSQCISQITLEKPGEISIMCPEAIYDIPCFDVDNGMIQSFLNGTIVESIYEFDVTNNYNPEDIDIFCEEAFDLEVTFTATDLCGNESSCFSQLSFLPPPNIYIPNVFTPESFDNNSRFTVYGNISVKKVVSMEIFDRWGAPVFEKFDFDINDETEGWNGNKNNTLLHGQVFTYLIIVEDVFGEIHKKSGSIQLLR